MGAHGVGPFHNDTAIEWLRQLADGGGMELLAATLDSEAEGEQMLAAAEVVAAMASAPMDELPESVVQFVSAHDAADPELVARARRAVQFVWRQSELAEVWEDFEEWDDVVGDLLDRLGQSVGAG